MEPDHEDRTESDRRTEQSTDALELTHLRKTYGSVVAVDDVSLRVTPGTYHCLVGPNGSGKSTVLRLVLGLTRADSGTIQTPDAVIGCGFQEPNFYPALTVRQNIDVFASLVSADDWEWNQTVVDELRLNPVLDREAAELSGGYARKLDLALALIKRPQYLLLDEPLGALDDVSKEQLLALLSWYVDEGNTVLVSTHHVTEFEPYLDRVTVMNRGRVLFDDWTDEIDLAEHDSLQSYYVSAVLNAEEPELLEKRL